MLPLQARTMYAQVANDGSSELPQNLSSDDAELLSEQTLTSGSSRSQEVKFEVTATVLGWLREAHPNYGFVVWAESTATRPGELLFAAPSDTPQLGATGPMLRCRELVQPSTIITSTTTNEPPTTQPGGCPNFNDDDDYYNYDDDNYDDDNNVKRRVRSNPMQPTPVLWGA
jgi:hypothetical protein